MNFNLLVAIDCSVIPINEQGEVTISSVYLQQTWTSSSNDFYNLDSTGINSTISSNILSPLLVDISPNNYPSGYGITNDILFEYINTGVGANISFVFDPGMSCSGYIGDSLEFAIRDTSGIISSYTSYSFPNSQSVYLPHDFSIVIKRKITVIDCLSDCNNEKGFFKWRCDSLPGADSLFCEDCQETFESNYVVADSYKGKLKLERISPSRYDAEFDFSCPGDNLMWIFRIKNTGDANVASANILIGYNGFDPFSLTDVSLSTVYLDTNSCSGCSVDTIVTLRSETSHCGIIDPLYSLTIHIQELASGDSIDVSFSTTRCCSENDSILLDAVKKFNHWQILTTGIDSCGLVSHDAVSYENQPQIGSSNGISTHSLNNLGNLNLDLSFIPTVSDLTVPKDTNFGESATMYLDFEGLFPQIIDYQIVGCDTNPTCQMNGFLRARIYTEVGLHITDFSSVYFRSDTIADWLPEFYYTTIDTMQCDSGYYYFYFNLADSSARDMLKAGDLMFTFQSCCGDIEIAQTDYEFAFHLLMNPDNCSVITPPVDIYTAPACSSCCWLPLSSIGDYIAVHCPGCVAPGIIVDNYSLERLNYGLEDDDNNMRADSSLTQIQKGSTYYDSHPLIRSNFSMHSDQLQDILVAHFEPGTSYNYSAMIDSPSTAYLKYLQLFRSIGEFNAMGLQVNEFDFYIDVPDSNGGCKDCAVQNIADTNYRTIQQNYIPQDSLDDYILTLGDTVFCTFGIDTINNKNNLFRNIIYLDSLFAFDEFAENQRYRLVVRYSVCGNWYSFNDDWKQSSIQNFMWLTGSEKPYYATGPQAPDSVVFPVYQSFADNFLFYCEKLGGRHFFVSNVYENKSGSGNDGCDNGIGVYAISQIGGLYSSPLSDIFPYEIRTPAYKPLNYKIELPLGANLNNAVMHSASIYTSATVPFSVTPDSLNHYYFSNSIYSAPKCITDTTTIPLDTSFYVYDQYMNLRFNFDLEFDSCQTGYAAVAPIFIEFDENNDGCIVNAGTTCDNDSIQIIVPISSGGNITMPNPDLVMQIEHLTVEATQTEICWDFIIRNVPDTGITNAYNIYLIPPDSVGFPNLQSWHVQLGGNTIYPDTNGVIHLADQINAGDTLKNVSICADFVTCYEGLPDPLTFTWGWNCDDFPVPGDPVPVCFEKIDTLLIDDSPGGIDANVVKFNSDPIALCDTLYFGVIFPAADTGFVYPDSLFLTELPLGLQIINAYIGRDSSSVIVDSLLLPNSTPGWLITDSMLTEIGFPQSGFNYPGKLKVSYFAIPGCDYDSTLPTHNLLFHNYCFDTTIASVPHNSPIPVSGSVCNNCFTITKTASQDTVIALTDTVIYTITVCTNNGGPEIINLIEYLPVNFNVLSSNFPATDTIPGDTCFVYNISGIFALTGSCIDNFNTAQVSTVDTTVQDSACVTVLPVCYSWSYVFIPDSSFATSYPSGFQNDTFFIEGRFYVDSNYFTIFNSTLLVNAGGQIIILPSGGLNIDSSLIQGCDQMWRGIFMDGLSSLAVVKQSTIKDAETAVYASDKTSIKLKNSSFEDNIRGLWIPPKPSGMYTISTAIYGNRFGLFGAGFKPGYPAQPSFGDIPYSGIEINDIIMDIGADTVDSNYFYNLNQGIIGYESYLSVINNKFSNIKPDNFYAEPFEGAAIVSIGDTSLNNNADLTVEPLTSGAVTMDSCVFGVYTDYSSLDIGQVSMSEMYKGVYSTNCTDLLNTRVWNCSIEASSVGIHFRFNAGANSMVAMNNQIALRVIRSIGILAQESNTAFNVPYTIQQNTIEADNSRYGIAIFNLNQPILSENTVRLSSVSSPFLMDGITVNGCVDASVTCNEVFGDDVSDTLKTAIRTTSSNDSEISCNVVDSTGYGILFDAPCPGTIFLSNSINNHFEGLRLTGSAIIDPQSLRGNTWNGSYGSGFGAVNLNSANAVIVSLNRFDIQDSTAGTIFHPVNFVTCSLCNWFVFTPGTPDECIGQDTCINVGSGNRFGEDLFIETMIAIDSISTVDYEPEAKSITRQYLFDKLIDDSSLVISIPIFTDFFATFQNSEKDLLKRIKDIQLLSTQFDWQLSELKVQYDSLVDSLSVIININNQQIAEGNQINLTLQQQNLDYLDDIITIKSILSEALSQREISQITLTDSISVINNQIVANDVISTNEKAINEIEKLVRAGDSLSASFINELFGIANQCPASGGKAVFRARSLYSLFNDSIEYDDLTVCLTQGYQRADSSPTALISESYSFIQPNPATDKAELIYSLPKSENCIFQIQDGISRVIYTSHINCNETRFSFSTATLTSGMFIYYIKSGNTIVSKGKFSVQK